MVHMRKKRLQITDSSGWTHVITGPKQIPLESDLVCRLQILDLDSEVPIAKIAEKQDKYNGIWRESECCTQLLHILEQDVLTRKSLLITRCICLGLGSFTSGRESSKYQLATLIWMLEILHTKDAIQEIVFQDPAFTNSDINYLESLGFTVLDSPHGFDRIDPNTFLFAPHLESNIYALALQNDLPALSLGSEVEAFIDRPITYGREEAKEQEKSIFQRFRKAMALKSMPGFERDMWCHFTNIYWMKDFSHE
ncbi:MAG: hypothetical protein Q9164_000501 [Protoblastenia rupestris]